MDDTSVIYYSPRALGSPFLSLPGELRNRIYDFCAEEGAVSLPAPHTCFGNLRYVCKLLRTEFTSIYLASTAITVSAADIDRYFAAFYPELQLYSGVMPCESTARIRDTHGPAQIRIDIPIGATLELSSFANVRSTKLQITIVRGGSINQPLIEASMLLRTIMDPSCSVDFQKTVDRMLFRYSLQPEVVIKLHRWIRFENMSDVMTSRNPRQWLIQQDLPAVQHLKIVMESSEGVLRSPVGTGVARFRRSRGYMQLRPVAESGGSIRQIPEESRYSKVALTLPPLSTTENPDHGAPIL